MIQAKVPSAPRCVTARPQVYRLLTALACVALGEAGCATHGPNHVYFAADSDPAVHDLGPQGADLAQAIAPDEHVLGLAYDFNTDHLFLRVVPAQVIRVIERPSGKVLREMPLPAELQTGPVSLPRSVPEDTASVDKPRAPSREQSGADLAIRSSDRHLFAVGADRRSIVELTLFGEFVRRIAPTGLGDSIGGLAYDQRRQRLLLLTQSNPARIGAIAPAGGVIYYMTLPAGVAPVSLGYDSDADRYFVPLQDGRALGEFDAAGTLVRQFPTPGNFPITAVDAGPRSFVRVF